MGAYAAFAATAAAEGSSTEDSVEEAAAATAAASRERESVAGAAGKPPGGKRKRKKRSGAVRLSRVIATHRGIETSAKAQGFQLVQEQAAITASRYEQLRTDAYHKARIDRRQARLEHLEGMLRALPKPRGSFVAPVPCSCIPSMCRPPPRCLIPTLTQDLSPPPRPSKAVPQPHSADSPQTPTFPSSPAEATQLQGLRYIRPPPLPFKGPPPRPSLEQAGPWPSKRRVR